MKKHSKTLTDVSKRMLIEKGMNMVAGLDLGDKYSHLWLLDLDGRVVESKKIRTSAPALEKYFSVWAAMRHEATRFLTTQKRNASRQQG